MSAHAAAHTAACAAFGSALAERLDAFIVWRGKLERPPERLALTWPQIDSLEEIGAIDWSHRNTPTGGERIPFYRGFLVVVQGDWRR